MTKDSYIFLIIFVLLILIIGIYLFLKIPSYVRRNPQKVTL